MDKDAQGYTDLSDLDLTSVILKVTLFRRCLFYRQIYNINIRM